MTLLEELGGFFAAQGLRAYLVGGFIRDTLLGNPCHDVDVAVEGDVAPAARSLAQALDGALVPLDPKRGIFRVALQQGGEASAEEASDTPRHWTVDLSAALGAIQEDLGRRDFTIDAMAVPFPEAAGPAPSWPLLDPFGGQADLRDRRVRLVDPGAFQADPLRLLRAVRLAVQLGFQIEPHTLALLGRDAALVGQVAAERVRDELLAILAQPGLERSLGLLDQQGLLHALLPELTPARGVSQPFEHFWDVYDHSLQCAVMVERVLDPEYRRRDPAAQAIPWQPWTDGYFAQEVSDGHTRATLLKLAGLLHDVAKPETKTLEPSGRARFLGHPTVGADKAEAILRRLRLSGRGIALVRTLVEHHLRPGHLAQRDELPTPRAIYRYFRDLGDVAIDALYLSLADYLAARGPTLELEEWRFHCGRVTQTLELGLAMNDQANGGASTAPQMPPKLVDGNDLVDLFGLQPGPAFRPLLEAVREAQAAGEINTREGALALLERTLGLRALEESRRSRPA